jgi:integrase
MPRSIKLSWQPGSRGKPGYWKKFYKGKVHYFPSGSGKSDTVAYDTAWAMWEQKKAEIDRTTPRKYQQDYELAIDEWEAVLSWSNRHGDREFAEVATRKLASLRPRFASLVLPPLDRLDRLEACLGGPLPTDPKWLAEIRKSMEEDAGRSARERIESLFGHPETRTPKENETIEKLIQVDQLLSEVTSGIVGPRQRPLLKPSDDWYSPGRIKTEIWRDRLKVQQREAASEDQSLKAHIERYVGRKEKHGNAGQISVGRVRATKIHLAVFQDWLGKDFDVAKIDEEVLEGFHSHLLDKVASKTWSGTTASDCMSSVKSLVRSLWVKKAIANLPRTLDPKCKDLLISKSNSKIEVFTKDEIKVLLAKANDRTRLYILLMLNIGATQKDISDLLVSEVDWNAGRVIRKRSKTSDQENVPVVDYLLWPETFRLLKQYRASESTDRVLLNSNGSPIWAEKNEAGGKFRKSDNIKSAFDRLRKKTSINKPPKSLKKTSATLLRNNKDYSGLESLFLGHAPRGMADKHYTKVPQELLDQAVTWLGQEYGFIERPDAAKPENSEVQPGASAPAPEPDAAEPAANQEGKARTSGASRRSKAAKARPAASRGTKADTVPGM